jgi:hypothetical protein
MRALTLQIQAEQTALQWPGPLQGWSGLYFGPGRYRIEVISPQRGFTRAAFRTTMLHCNMESVMSLALSLEDLLAELRHARRQGDLGRLALISYCEVRRWARDAGMPWLAEQSAAMVTQQPMATREAFLERVDQLVFELERVRHNMSSRSMQAPSPMAPAAPSSQAGSASA